MAKYIDADKLKAEIEKRLSIFEHGIAYDCWAACKKIVESLQQEQPEVDLEKVVEFECVGKKVKMTIQELINYYIDSECCDVADECGF